MIFFDWNVQMYTTLADANSLGISILFIEHERYF